jgi:hypothetical protein
VPLVRVGQHVPRHQDYRVTGPAGARRTLPERRDLLLPDGAGELAGEVIRVVHLPGPLHSPHELRALDRPRRRHRVVFKKDATHVMAPALTTYCPSGPSD